MSAVGGSIVEVTLDGRSFPATADAEVQRKLGGSTNEVQANGDGATARQIKTAEPWSLDGLVLSLDDALGDHEFLQALANGNSFFPVAITYANTETYQGEGQIVGDLQGSSQSTSATVSLMGQGTLTKQ